MSARYLKKVLLEEEEFKSQQQQIIKDSDSDFDDDDPPSSSPNLFHLLNDDNDVQEENHIEHTSLNKHHTSVVKEEEIPSSNCKSKKKKKKTKKKKNTKLSSNKQDKNDEEDSLDVILKKLSLVEKSSSNQQLKSSTVLKNQCAAPSILQVDPKFLSAENELKRIFGSKVVSSFENSSNQAGTSRQMRGVKRGGTHNHKKTILVSPSDHWHRWDGSLSMELLETRDGNHYFRYVHSSSYSQAQREFETAKAMNDLDSISAILGYHPYHLESLLTLAEYFKLVGEHQRASDFITKCLYALECAWHPMFTPLQGNCKLKFCHETNQPFFTTLFIHMRNLDRRGCHRCALEMCKVLLSLDSDDAKGAMHCIDYFALRAEQYTWLERFSEEYRSASIGMFPNFSYSLAVSRFYNEQENDLSEGSDSAKATSSELMKKALMLHPSILKKLVEKVPLKDQYWTSVTKHDLFKSDQSGSPSLDHLSDIYVERSYLIWRLPELQNLLTASVVLVIEETVEANSSARDWACARKEGFPSKKNEYAHLLVSDFSDAKPSTLPENVQQLMVDPARVVVANPPRDDRRMPRDVANRNVVTVLLESILPWNNFGAREDEQANEED